MKKRILTICLVMALLFSVAACGMETGTKEAAGEAAENMGHAESGEEAAVLQYTETKDDVTVVLSTDREAYAEGEEIHWALTVENERQDWTIANCGVQVRTGGGLVFSEDAAGTVLKQVKTGEQAVLSGTFFADASAASASAGKTGTAVTGAETLSLSPHAKVLVDGEARTFRLVLEMPMVQVVMRVDGAHRHAPKNVTVHDPSIFKDRDGTYYLVGTHITGAKSSDLFDWEQTDDTFRAALSEENREQIRAYNADETVGHWNDYLWAPDIFYNETMGKYCVYLSANGDHWQSNIVLLTGDAAEGPFTYAGTVVYGGFTEDNWRETDVGEVLEVDELPERYIQYGVKNSHWGDRFPNCIDPCVFRDEEGKLWMSYGSWSGGIFLLALDEATGLRDRGVTYPTQLHTDAYFGKLIAGGSYVSGEGSYIQYIGGYYWLFVSYGNLEARGGYNIRVFRSEKPDGPYVDALGNTPFYDAYRFNYNEPVGIRLFGGYKWRVMSEGQVAQGHNSALLDDDGRAYIVYHTRTTNGSEGHFVQVHQLFVNRNGWLVAAPYRTDGERLSEKGLDAGMLAGDYEIILHRLHLDYADYEVNRPENITLGGDGTVSGDYAGRWEAEAGTPYITLWLDAGEARGARAETVAYRGVALTMEIDGTDIETPVFTALGEENQLALWGSKRIEE